MHYDIGVICGRDIGSGAHEMWKNNLHQHEYTHSFNNFWEMLLSSSAQEEMLKPCTFIKSSDFKVTFYVPFSFSVMEETALYA